MKPQTVPCTYCGAPVGKGCQNPWGRRAHYAHAARKRTAANGPSSKIEKEESFHYHHAMDMTHQTMVYGSAEQRRRAQEAFETWLPRLLAYFGPPDSDTYRSNPMYRFGLKVRSNDELRQQWLTKIIPVFTELGIHVDPELASFDDERQEWDYASPDWVETKRIIKEGGPRYEQWRSQVARSLERNATYRDVALKAAA